MGFDFNTASQALSMVNKFANMWSTGGTTSTDGTGGTTSTGGSSGASQADVKEYNALLEKQKNGKLTSNDQARLRELRSSLSKAGALNNDGSIRSGRNNDRIKREAQKMSWDEVAAIHSGNQFNQASRIATRVSSNAMSMNGSVFGGRRV